MGKKPASRSPSASCAARLGQLTVQQALVGLLGVGALLLLLETRVLPHWDYSVSDYFAREGEAAVDKDDAIARESEGDQPAMAAASVEMAKNGGYGLYPPEILASEWADEVPRADLVHLSLLHDACLSYRNDVIPWTYGSDGREPVKQGAGIIKEDDPDVLDKIRACPDVDIFLPEGIRSHGYCEDAIAYTKFLKSRLLPRWAIDKKYYDKKTGNYVGYHELCPKTPMIFFNHYWDGVTESKEWPAAKPLYLMPNIEMYELQASHYWGADVVLCKTAICARRVRQWYAQEGNPRNTRVIYTRHTSSDVATLARVRLGDAAIRPKNFTDVQFVHAIGTSVQKGTREVLNCWLGRPDFPPLHIYMANDIYDGWLKAAYDERVKESQVVLHLGRVDASDFGRMIAETAFFLCTSVHEGYGHYINQARASSAVIVTTDVPPMNELLSRQSGLLIPSNRLTIDQQLMGGNFKGEHGLRDVEGMTAGFEGDGVCRAVEQVLAMTPEERELMAVRARKQYLIDMNFFAAKMQELRALARGDNDGTGNLRLGEGA